MNFFKEALERVKCKTPPFFRIIRKVGVAITTICTPIVAIPTTYTGAIISDTLIKICSHMLIAGVIMISVASLTRVPPETKTDNNGTLDTTK